MWFYQPLIVVLSAAAISEWRTITDYCCLFVIPACLICYIDGLQTGGEIVMKNAEKEIEDLK